VTASSGAREGLERVFRAALAAVDAGEAVRCAIEEAGRDGDSPLARAQRIRVLAVGKAAASMSAACEAALGERIVGGLAVTKDGHGAPLARVALREAGHPVPDARSERAAREALTLVTQAGRDDVLLVLISGGASSLLACPAPGLSLGDVSETTGLLLAAGADIAEMNAVRKHLSAVAGGRLGAAAEAPRVEVLVISDVPGDRLDVIGSGPFCGDPTTYADALAVLERFDLVERVPGGTAAHLTAGARRERPETPKPGNSAFDRVRTRVLASNQTAVDAAERAARELGWVPRTLPEFLSGEASDAGRRLAALAKGVAAGPATEAPRCLIAGGETVVTVRGGGRGGRNQELALAAACELAGREGITLLAAGTDGGDGPTDAAGAFADGGTLARGRAAGASAESALADNDSNGFFRAEGGLLTTGPTGTNVMDLAIVVVDPGAR